MPEDFRAHAIYRSQWTAVPVPYRTVGGSYDTRWFTPRWKQARIGLGGWLQTDRSGDSQLTTTQIAISGSYGRVLQSKHWLYIGAQTYLTQQYLPNLDLTFDEQFNGEQFDPTISPTELLARNRTTIADIGVGLNYQYQGKDKEVNVGLGYSNILAAARPFITRSAPSQLPKVNIYAEGRLWLTPKYGYSSGAFFTFQGLSGGIWVYRQAVLHAGWMYRSSPKNKLAYTLHLGVHWRIAASLIPYIEVGRQQWRVMVSYDFTLSDFSTATQSRGGMEIGIRYAWKRVVPPSQRKACPVF